MSKSVECLCGNAVSGVAVTPAAPKAPFSEDVCAFLADLSATLLHDGEAKGYADVITFAFFCRRASVEALRAPYAQAEEVRLGRGLAFHIAPGNVPVNFAYSLVSALLGGCQSVVKASSKDFAQTRIICRAMQTLFAGDHAALAPYVNVVMYPHEETVITEAFSAACDVRIIWGGDETVRRVRQAPLQAHAFDITFPDRVGLMVIRADAVMQMEEKTLAQTAQGFYNDTYLTDQNACTSPRLVYWLGGREEVARAKERFWAAVRAYAAPRYAVEAVVAVDKLTAACRAAIELGAKAEAMPDNVVTRVTVDALQPELEKHRSAGGFFLEYASETLDALPALITPKFQTLAYIGMDARELAAFVQSRGLRGVGHIAPVGHTMDFDLTWDGFDLIRSLSRRITAI